MLESENDRQFLAILMEFVYFSDVIDGFNDF